MQTGKYNRQYIQSSGLANDFLISMADGMILPFALAALMSFIVTRAETVLWACLTESIILAVLFGIASYLTVINQVEEYPNEDGAVKRGNFVPHLQLLQIIANLNLGPEILSRAAEEGEKYKARWSDLLASHDLGEVHPDFEKAKRSGFYTAIAFLIGALLPVAPYIFSSSSLIAFKFSAIVTGIGLILFGYFKAAYIGQNAWKVILRLLITEIIVASFSLLLAYFFRL
ncbi:MAG: VIT1/CCC1 transporter family protein [Chitinophagaceae bacterium]